MNREEKNIAIAKICGNPYHRPSDQELRDGSYYQFEPDYFTDLNAVSGAEKTCEDTERYYCMLATVVSGKTCYKISEAHHERVFVATAAQRAEAVLRYHEESTG